MEFAHAADRELSEDEHYKLMTDMKAKAGILALKSGHLPRNMGATIASIMGCVSPSSVSLQLQLNLLVIPQWAPCLKCAGLRLPSRLSPSNAIIKTCSAVEGCPCCMTLRRATREEGEVLGRWKSRKPSDTYRPQVRSVARARALLLTRLLSWSASDNAASWAYCEHALA